MIIILVGESASGKSTIEKMVSDRLSSFKKIVSYTTRPMRDGEKNGVDYHFVSNEEFNRMKNKGDFIESASYRDWYYGSAKEDYLDGQNHIAVLTPHGCRLLKKYCQAQGKTDVYTVYLSVDRKSRMIKILERGDNIDEAYRRNISDVGQFDGFEDEADLIINNGNYQKGTETIYDELISFVSSKEKRIDE